MKQLLILFIVLVMSCLQSTGQGSTSNLSKANKIEVIPLNTGTEFKFKGLAVDVKNGKAYLGSWDKKQIVVVSLKDKTYKPIETKYSGKLNGMGVFLKGNRLYAVMNEVDDDPKASPISVLVVIDVASNKVLHSYEAKAVNGRHHFNHVVVDDNGIAYISNTLKSSIYTVDTKNPGDALRKLVAHEDLSWVHGIDLSPDGSILFSTAYDGGVRFYDLKTKTFSSFRDTSTNENDGLKYYQGNLYGIGENALKKYTLNKEQNKILKTEVLLADHEFFNDPRCLHIEDGWIYCLANIELEIVTLRNGVPNTGKKAFTDSYILKYKI